jgi:hypothetical protein
MISRSCCWYACASLALFAALFTPPCHQRERARAHMHPLMNARTHARTRALKNVYAATWHRTLDSSVKNTEQAWLNTLSCLPALRPYKLTSLLGGTGLFTSLLGLFTSLLGLFTSLSGGTGLLLPTSENSPSHTIALHRAFLPTQKTHIHTCMHARIPSRTHARTRFNMHTSQLTWLVARVSTCSLAKTKTQFEQPGGGATTRACASPSAEARCR